MSNYCDEAFYQQNIYTNTYSLWENSAYYDINNLSPQNFSSSWHRGNDEDFETRYTSGPTEADAPEPEPPDHRNRRVVERASLYEDPDLFYQDVTEETPSPVPVQSEEGPPVESTPARTEWTQLNWHRAGEECEEGPSSKNKGKMPRTNRIQKKLDKMLSKPVKMSKAESMMQKMGWHGGALGRTATGIVEPIAPNAIYATKKTGFGQAHPQKPKSKETKPKENIQYFNMNVLYNIYEFVKNNSEIELLFDRKLRNDERKRVHYVVSRMDDVDDTMVKGFDAQTDLVLSICDINCYILHTQSEGEHPNRQLCVYKEAPPHVYLIIPDDLREEPTIAQAPPEAKPVVEEYEPEEPNEPEEETNPFLRSITRNLKKKEKVVEPPKRSRIFVKIVQYFTEFTVNKKFSQFKFLGPFTDEELESIRDFMDQAAQYLANEPVELREVFSKIKFKIAEDITGNTVINKIPM